MLKLRTATFLLLSLCVMFSCSSTKDIAGTYHTNFADLGFFGTTIRLKPDSTLQYIFQGDLMYDSTTGHYAVRDHKVYIIFDKEVPDTTRLYHRFDIMPLKTAVVGRDSVSYQSFLFIGHNKLFFAHAETGRKVTKARRYNKRKKYLLFGSHYYKRRWYLKPVN